MAASRRTFLASLLAVASPTLFAHAQDASIGIVFHVASVDGVSVADEVFIADQLAHAQAIFGSLGIKLVDRGRASLAERHAHLVTREDRDALAPYVRRADIHCMVVAQLMDVDESGRVRRGVHWHERTGRHHWVIVSAIAGSDVLAHELGHYFGNARHSDTPGNLMSYERGQGPPFLDDSQIARIHASLSRMLAGGELVARTP